jgi:hypothetical protein
MTIGAFLMAVLFSLYSIPNFAIIFFSKAVDIYSYKKLGTITKAGKYIFYNLIAICVANLMLIGVQSLPTFVNSVWAALGPACGMFFVPVMTIIIQIVLYLVERKLVNDKIGKVRPITLSFLINVVMSMLYNVMYYQIIQWNTNGVLILPDTDEEPFTMDHFDIIINAILLLVIFVVVKIVIQAILVRIAKKKKEQQQLPEEA